MVKNEVLLLARMAVVLTVVDSLIPRVETIAKSKMNQYHRSSQQSESSEQGQQHPQREIPRHHWSQPLTEMHMGLFDLNVFHGSAGSGGAKESLDEQLDLRRKVGSSKIDIKSAKMSIKNESSDHAAAAEQDTPQHQKTVPTFFWDFGKK